MDTNTVNTIVSAGSGLIGAFIGGVFSLIGNKKGAKHSYDLMKQDRQDREDQEKEKNKLLLVLYIEHTKVYISDEIEKLRKNTASSNTGAGHLHRDIAKIILDSEWNLYVSKSGLDETDIISVKTWFTDISNLIIDMSGTSPNNDKLIAKFQGFYNNENISKIQEKLR